MFDKKKGKTNSNPYSNLRPADAHYFSKLDEKIALAQKQNKKEFCEFLIDKKEFDMNFINVKNNNKIGKIDLLPSSLLSILNARDNEKVFENYKKDTTKIAKLLFDDDMTIQQICATACEFVRLSTANFDRYESESVQNPQSALCQLVSTNAYGMLSFYFGVSNAIDQTKFLAWLINLGLDIKHSLSYAECVIDSYGNPICHIVEFNGKLGISLINYVGVAKAYVKKIETLTGLCQFIDFTDEIENGKKRALKVLSRYVPNKLMIKGRDIENSLTSMAQIAYKNMSDVTATELNMLSRFDNKIWKFSTLCELLLYENNVDYEVILDLFVETQYALKLKVGDEGKFKIFPNKVIDEEYHLNESKMYILNKMAKTAPMNHEDELFDERIESIGRESGESADAAYDEFVQARSAQSGFSRQSADQLSLDNLEPMSAADVLSSLNVKFTPRENEGLSFENGSFKFNDDELNEVFDLSSVTQVDFSKADAEQRMLESSMGIASEPTQSNTPPKRKGFFELLNEMSEKTKKNKARRLQEEYERLERNHELKTPEEVIAQQNHFAENDNIVAENDNIDAQNYSVPTESDNILVKNDKIVEQTKDAPIQSADTTMQPKIATVQKDNLPVQDAVIENYDAINAINQEFYELKNEQANSLQEDEIQNIDTTNESEEYLEDIAENDLYGDIMQFSDYNYYDRTKENEPTEDETTDENDNEAEVVVSNENIVKEPTEEPKEVQKEEPAKEFEKEQQESQQVPQQPKEEPEPTAKVEKRAPVQQIKTTESTKITEPAKPEPAKKTSAPATAPRAFAPPIPKRKPAPPLPKRKK